MVPDTMVQVVVSNRSKNTGEHENLQSSPNGTKTLVFGVISFT